MTVSAPIRVGILAGAALALSSALAAAAPPPSGASTEARATIVRLSIPGQGTVALGDVAWPDTAGAEVQSFVYPGDGAVIRVGLSRAVASAQTGGAAASQASAETIARLALRRRRARGPGGGPRECGSKPSLGRGRRRQLDCSGSARARTGRLTVRGREPLARRLGDAPDPGSGHGLETRAVSCGTGLGRGSPGKAQRGARRFACRERDRRG